MPPDLTYFKGNTQFLGAEEKVIIIITRWGGAMGLNVTGKQLTGLNYSREINYACASFTEHISSI
jgi:hypothetical protein